MNFYGRDNRRRLSRAEANFLYMRANGKCEKCDAELGSDWHAAHGIAWCNGGATTIDQMQAQCASCNLHNGTGNEIELKNIVLREWQELAIPKLEYAIFRQGFATLYAAPGAGKTICAGTIFKHLFDQGIVKRLVILSPNTAIVDQWKSCLANEFGIHIDDRPRDGHIEHPDTIGLVTTYHTLAMPGMADAFRNDFLKTSTMLIPDEVHHLGDKAAWGKATTTAAGDIDKELYAEVVLNTTGTLFRSGKNQRISTVKYFWRDDGKLEAIADYKISTSSLIGVDLRGIDALIFDGDARLIDLVTEQEVIGKIYDLSEPERHAVVRYMIKQPAWRRGYVQKTLELFRRQLDVGLNLPLKTLFVCSTQSDARLIADEVNTVMNDDFARLIVSDEPKSSKLLKDTKRQKKSLAYVTVNMISEGFDDENICLIGFCSNITAQLRINQIAARAMRLSQAERKAGLYLPAKIVIPNTPELVKAFAQLVAEQIHTIELDPNNPSPPSPDPGGPRLPRFELLDLSNPELNRASVLGLGDADRDSLKYYEPLCTKYGIPLAFSERTAVLAMKEERPNFWRKYSHDT